MLSERRSGHPRRARRPRGPGRARGATRARGASGVIGAGRSCARVFERAAYLLKEVIDKQESNIESGCMSLLSNGAGLILYLRDKGI